MLDEEGDRLVIEVPELGPDCTDDVRADELGVDEIEVHVYDADDV